MRKKIRLIISLVSSLMLAGSAFSQNCTSYFSGQYTPKTQIRTDSIFYLFTLKSVYEVHSNKEYTNIYSIKWHDHCTFELVLESSSDKSGKNEITGRSTWKVRHNKDSSVTIAIKDAGQEKEISLEKYVQSKVSTMMLTRDNEYRKMVIESMKDQKWQSEVIKDSLTKIKFTVDTSLQLKIILNYLQKDLDNYLNIRPSEIGVIENMISDFKNFNGDDFYRKASPEYREDVSAESNRIFFTDYLKQTCGQMEYFSLSRQTARLQGDDIISKQEPSKYEFDIKFMNISKEFKLKFSVSRVHDSLTGKTHSGVRNFLLSSPEYFKSVFIDSLTRDFFKNLETRNYDAILSSFDSVYKEQTPEDHLRDILKRASVVNENKRFTLFRQGLQVTRQNKLIFKAL